MRGWLIVSFLEFFAFMRGLYIHSQVMGFNFMLVCSYFSQSWFVLLGCLEGGQAGWPRPIRSLDGVFVWWVEGYVGQGGVQDRAYWVLHTGLKRKTWLWQIGRMFLFILFTCNLVVRRVHSLTPRSCLSACRPFFVSILYQAELQASSRQLKTQDI